MCNISNLDPLEIKVVSTRGVPTGASTIDSAARECTIKFLAERNSEERHLQWKLDLWARDFSDMKKNLHSSDPSDLGYFCALTKMRFFAIDSQNPVKGELNGL